MTSVATRLELVISGAAEVGSLASFSSWARNATTSF